MGREARRCECSAARIGRIESKTASLTPPATIATTTVAAASQVANQFIWGVRRPSVLAPGVHEMTNVGGELFFVDYDGALWKSDGSTAGTNRVIEVAAASGGGSPRGLTAVGDALLFLVGVGDSLYFVAKDDRRGAELWSLDLADVAQDVASRRFALAPELAFAAAMPIGSAKFEPFDWLDDRS